MKKAYGEDIKMDLFSQDFVKVKFFQKTKISVTELTKTVTDW